MRAAYHDTKARTRPIIFGKVIVYTGFKKVYINSALKIFILWLGIPGKVLCIYHRNVTINNSAMEIVQEVGVGAFKWQR
jgi:hypothetical protein